MTGTVTEAGFVYGLSEGAMTQTIPADDDEGNLSATLSGLTESTTYYVKSYVTVSGTGDKSSVSETFYGSVVSFRTLSLPTWLDSYEIPANNASSVSGSNTLYQGFYSHSTVDETYGDTKAAVYNTSNANQRIVTHTFEYNSKVLSNYTMLFDKTKKCALWIAYKHENTNYRDNGISRSNTAWAYDPALDQSWQPNLSSSYPDSDYDRGHQVASADRLTTTEQNQQTFYYSNMTPQFATLNQQRWRTTVEEPVQSVANAISGNDVLYVVTGPLFSGTIQYTTDRSGANCALPTGYFKCIMKCSFNAQGEMTGARGCAYIVETNSENVSATLTSIDYVETKTGFDFFANVPDSLEAIAEAQSSAL